MKTSQILFILSWIIGMTLAFRSQSSGISVGPKQRNSHKQDHHAKSTGSSPSEQDTTQQQHFNIGLIVPHTSFGISFFTFSIKFDNKRPIQIKFKEFRENCQKFSC